MKDSINMFENSNTGLNILINGNKSTESDTKISFENSNDALDSLYETYIDSVNRFIEHKSTLHSENLLMNHMKFEKSENGNLDSSICESVELKVNQAEINLNMCIEKIQTWVKILENSINDNDDWNYCVETSKKIVEIINNDCVDEESLLKVVKESLMYCENTTWNKDIDKSINILKEGDKIMKNTRVSQLIAKKEVNLNEFKLIAESAELVNEVNEFKQSIDNLKIKIYDNDGEVTQEAYEMLMDLDVLEEGLKEKIKNAGEKRIDKKIAKKEAQIEKLKGNIESKREEINGLKEKLAQAEEGGVEKQIKRAKRNLENAEFDIEEIEEDIEIIKGEIEKLKGKKKAQPEEVCSESYISLVFDDEVLEESYVEEGVKEKIAQIKDKRIAKKIAKKEAQIEKIKAKIEAEKQKENRDFDIEEMEEDIAAYEKEIEKLKSKVKKDEGEMTQEAYEMLMDLDVLEEGLKAKVKAIGDKKLNKKLAKRENLLGKMKQMLVDVQDEGHKEKLQSDIAELEGDIEKIRAKMEKNIDEVVQESYLDVVFESNIFDEIEEYDYLDEGLRQKIRGMKDDHLVKKIDKKEAKVAEKKIKLGEMETPKDDKKKEKVEKEIEKLEKEIERLKGKVKSEPGDNIVEGQCESFDADVQELLMLESMIADYEEKIEAKQQALNESYSYKNEVEIEILEEGLKEMKEKVGEKMDSLSAKCLKWVASKYKSQISIEKHIEELQATIQDAQNLLKERESEGKGKKIGRCVGRVITAIVSPPLLMILKSNATGLSTDKDLRKAIKYANMEIEVFREQKRKLDELGKEETVQESTEELFTLEESIEIHSLLESIIEFEEKIEAKQQALNESYSYRNEVEIEILEEGLKNAVDKLSDAMKKKALDWVCTKYNTSEAAAKAIDTLTKKLQNAKLSFELLKARGADKAEDAHANIMGLASNISACGPLKNIVSSITKGKVIASVGVASALIALGGVLIKLYKKRKAELDNKSEEPTQESTEELFTLEEATELFMMIESIVEQEEKLEARQQALNESYSYRAEVEIDVLEEGLKEKLDNMNQKIYNSVAKKFKSITALNKHIEKININIESAETIMKERESEGLVKKITRVAGNLLTTLCIGTTLQNTVAMTISTNKQLKNVIKYANMEINACKKRISELEKLHSDEKSQEPVGESTDYKETFKQELDKIDFED